jgi:hypothetical protein
VDEPDFRGWTLLHISAGEGHTRRFFELGAEERLGSKACYTHMREELHGREVADIQVAEVCGYDRWLDILEAIRQVEGETFLAPREISALKTANEGHEVGDGLDDEWFVAPENLLIE